MVLWRFGIYEPKRYGGNMKVGDLVRYNEDGDIGIITEVGADLGDYYVQWADGTEGYHIAEEMEVI